MIFANFIVAAMDNNTTAKYYVLVFTIPVPISITAGIITAVVTFLS